MKIRSEEAVSETFDGRSLIPGVVYRCVASAYSGYVEKGELVFAYTLDNESSVADGAASLSTGIALEGLLDRRCKFVRVNAEAVIL